MSARPVTAGTIGTMTSARPTIGTTTAPVSSQSTFGGVAGATTVLASSSPIYAQAPAGIATASSLPATTIATAATSFPTTATRVVSSQAQLIAPTSVAMSMAAPVPVAMSLTAPTPAATSSMNLLAAGRVVSERVVSYDELLASGVLRIQGDPAPSSGYVMQQVPATVPAGVEPVTIMPASAEEAQPVPQEMPAEAQPTDQPPVEGGEIMPNQAFVFVKPHAVNDATIETVRNMLLNFGIAIAQEGDLGSEEIEQHQLIDRHYYAIASKATIKKPNELPVDDAKFQGKFGIPFEQALPTAYNAMDAMSVLESDVDELEVLWRQAQDGGQMVKLGGGFYCAQLQKPGKEPIYVFNAFFMKMRNEYTAPGQSIHWFAVEFDERAIPWEAFRGQVLGPTDPAQAPETSIRGTMFAHWQQLGLPSQPSTGTNCVHASASPLEAMFERMNWLGVQCAEDLFGGYLLNNVGVPEDYINFYSEDPQVQLPDGKVGSIWDFLEDSDTSTCVDKLVQVVNLQMAATPEQ